MQRLFRLTFMLLALVTLISGHAAKFKKVSENLSDSVITTKLTAKFTKDKQVNPFKIYVTTNHGRVMLKGRVKDKQAFLQAIRIAKTTKGVRSVNAEKLEINSSNTRLTDAYITAKVETAILRAKVLDDESIPLVGINATTLNGIVTLTGKVKNRSSIPFIIKRVSTVRGVKQVITQLTVQPLT